MVMIQKRKKKKAQTHYILYDFLIYIFRNQGKFVLSFIVLFIIISLFIHMNTEPGKEVSLFYIIKYTKKNSDQEINKLGIEIEKKNRAILNLENKVKELEKKYRACIQKETSKNINKKGNGGIKNETDSNKTNWQDQSLNSDL